MSLIRSAGAALPSALQPVARSIYHTLFRANLRARCFLADLTEHDDARGPVPPAMLRFRVCESLSREEFFRIGQGCARQIREQLERSGVNLMHVDRVLDFGCGCGRTLRWLLQHYPNVRFHGADVDQEAIAWCIEHFPSARFLVNAPDPPLPYADGYFDAIYCISVFTHLDEAMQDRWLAELSRLLSPDGLLLLSIHGESAAALLDDEGQAQFRSAGFVHRRSMKMQGIAPEWYQTTWHSRTYIERRLAKWFQESQYESVPGGAQDFVVAARPVAIR